MIAISGGQYGAVTACRGTLNRSAGSDHARSSRCIGFAGENAAASHAEYH